MSPAAGESVQFPCGGLDPLYPQIYQQPVDNALLITQAEAVGTTEAERARALDEVRRVVLAAGAGELQPRPWQHPQQPAADTDLLRYVTWLARDPAVDSGVLAAGLGLVSSARAELDQLEAALLFAARAAGLTYQQIGQALGLGSAQAAQQRMGRVVERTDRGA